MRRSRPSRGRAPFYLLILCIGLASFVYWQIEYPPAFPSGIVDADQPSELDPTRAPQAEFTFPPLAEFSEIAARPLFSPSRRPPAETEEPDDEEDAPPKPLHFILTGVVISAEGQLALLRRINTAEVIRALLGQEIDGWQVERIESDRVTLRQGDTIEVVTLQDESEEFPARHGLSVREDEQPGVKIDEQVGVFEMQP